MLTVLYSEILVGLSGCKHFSSKHFALLENVEHYVQNFVYRYPNRQILLVIYIITGGDGA